MKRKPCLDLMEPWVLEHFPGEQGRCILSAARKEFDALCRSSGSFPPAFSSHTRNNIFPVAALYRSLLAEGLSREEAVDTADKAFEFKVTPAAEGIRSLLRFPGLYRLMPTIWKKAVGKLFGPDAGFEMTFYPTGGDRVRFDMTVCPYLEACRQLGCPELTPVFCHTDDICYGNMHPRLIWARTKTLARGGDCCDFDLFIKK